MKLLTIALMLFPSLALAAPFGVIKCATGSPSPTKFVQTVNAGPPTDVLPHLGADGIYYVVDAAALPQTPGVVLTVQPCNAFNCIPAKSYTVDVGAPAPLGAFEWRATKP